METGGRGRKRKRIGIRPVPEVPSNFSAVVARLRSLHVGRRLGGVNSSMSIALVAAREAARAHLARVRLLTCIGSPLTCTGSSLTCMGSDVRGEVVSPAERPAADRASERSLAAMNARVPRQLVTTRETQFARERIFKIGEHLAKLRRKMVDCLVRAPFALRFFPQRCITRHVSRITCV